MKNPSAWRGYGSTASFGAISSVSVHRGRGAGAWSPAAIFAVMTCAVPALEPQLAAGAKPAGIVISVMLGLFGLFTWYRLSTLASRHRHAATRTTRLAPPGKPPATTACASWASPSGCCSRLPLRAASGPAPSSPRKRSTTLTPPPPPTPSWRLLAWLALFLVTTISTSHYVHFAGKAKTDEG